MHGVYTRKHWYGKNLTVPVPGTLWDGYCRGTVACVPSVYPFFAKKKISGTGLVQVGYGSGTGRVGSNTGRDKTKPKRRHFRVNLKPYLSSPPDSLPLILFSATRFSLFFAFDSLCLSLPHSTADALGSLFLTSSLYRRRATEQKGRLWIWGLAASRQPEDFPHCGSDCGIFWFLFSFWIWLLWLWYGFVVFLLICYWFVFLW